MLKQNYSEINCDGFLNRVVGGSKCLEERIPSLGELSHLEPLYVTFNSLQVESMKNKYSETLDISELLHKQMMLEANDTRSAANKALITSMVMTSVSYAAAAISTAISIRNQKCSDLKM